MTMTRSWQCSPQVTDEFALALSKIYTPGDAVWFHDYHMALLAEAFAKHVQPPRPPMVRLGFVDVV